MTGSTQSTESLVGHQQDLAVFLTWVRFRLQRWFTFLLLGASVLLVAGHYTFGEWIFHPNLALWREPTYWWDGCKLIIWPVGLWLFWLVASMGRIKSAPVIVVAAGIVVLGDLVWYSVGEYLRDGNFEIPPDYWYWWTAWAPAVAIGGNLVLALRWFKFFWPHSTRSVSDAIAPQPWSWRNAVVKPAVLLLASVAVLLALVYVELPQMKVNELSLAVAREWLVPSKLKTDFDFLASNGGTQWNRYQLLALLHNLELSDLQRRQFYSNLDVTTYQHFVLSPEIIELPLPELDWRRPLWEYFHPSVRHLNAPGAAAQIVVRLLREHVGIDPSFDSNVGVETIWQEGVTDEKGFDRIYVAAMRAVGIAARLDGNAQAEMWNGTNWEPAPRPSIASLLQRKSNEF